MRRCLLCGSALVAVIVGLLLALAGATGAAVTAKHTAVGFPDHSASRSASGYSVEIAASYTSSGNPSLVANFVPNGALATPHFLICHNEDPSTCAPARHGQVLQPGRTPAGTVFEAVASYDGETYRAKTTVWDGTVRAISSPSVVGNPRVGERAFAHGARWAGGWRTERSWDRSHDPAGSGGRGPDFDFLQIEACRSRAATGCVTVSAPKQEYGPNNDPLIPERFVHWYLFAFDQRSAYDTVFGGVGYLSPEGVPPLKLSATVARSTPVGPID